MRRRTFGLALPLLPLPLAGCGDLPWLGRGEEAPLPGTRRSVILASDGPAADARIAGLAVTLPPTTPLSEWPQPGGTASHTLGNVAGAATLERIWRADIGSGGSDESPLLASPVIAAGKLFAMDGRGRVAALDAGSGGRLWSRDLQDRTPDRLASGGVTYDSGTLYATLAHGEVAALAPGDGGELWRVDLKAPLRAAPIAAAGKLFVRTADNQLLALSTTDGSTAWRHSGIFEGEGILGAAPVAVDGGVVVVAYSSGEVFALLLDTGRQLWTDSVLRPRRNLAADRISDITGAPVIDRERVYIAGAGGESAAFDLARGSRQWEVDLSSFQMPWVVGDFIFLVTERGELACLLRQGGRVRWVRSIAETLGREVPTGTLWTGPILVGGRLVVAGTTGDLLAFAPEDGAILAKGDFGNGTHLSPVVANGIIYVLDDRGTVAAFR